ncbi:MAG: UDP-3-O-(3-hydroxymyristoyl)glucosamine N-acyltransferase [Deltaproteobacteria bacterium]|nr:UDP-3-O-(3-hydroxymyristoyl)glucosamine N-acyltransferase [Deltaproteobacteria bacterium]
MPFLIEELARCVGAEAVGRTGIEVARLAAIDEAGPDAICPLLRKRYLFQMSVVPAAVLAPPALAEHALEHGVPAAIVHDHPVLALAALIDIFHPPGEEPRGVHPRAFVDPGARVHESAWIGPGAVVEAGAVIGEGCSIGPNAIICGAAELGRHVRVGPGAVIGHEGFGFAPGPDGPVKVRQVGRVVIGDYVEIGANTCVDRATLGATVVGVASKIDNLVQVGHNARIGKRVLVAGQAGLAGSTVVGDDVMLGGQAGVGDHLTIGERARVAARSGVVGDVPAGGEVAGYPALPRLTWLRIMARLARDAGEGADEKEGP